MLLGDIEKGRALKSTKHLMVDKSAPVIGKEGDVLLNNSSYEVMIVLK